MQTSDAIALIGAVWIGITAVLFIQFLFENKTWNK